MPADVDDREVLPPEEAASWDEFQARCAVKRLPWEEARRGLMALMVVFAVPAVIFWVVTLETADTFPFAVAIACTAGYLWFVCMTIPALRDASRRGRQLSRLRAEWQARADRGEIPMSAPGGPKIYRDQADPAR
jgi:hypothetical protein